MTPRPPEDSELVSATSLNPTRSNDDRRAVLARTGIRHSGCQRCAGRLAHSSEENGMLDAQQFGHRRRDGHSSSVQFSSADGDFVLGDREGERHRSASSSRVLDRRCVQEEKKGKKRKEGLKSINWHFVCIHPVTSSIQCGAGMLLPRHSCKPMESAVRWPSLVLIGVGLGRAHFRQELRLSCTVPRLSRPSSLT